VPDPTNSPISLEESMALRLVRFASAAAARFADQGVALENARSAATTLAQRRVDRLEVEHFLENHARARGHRPPIGRAVARGFHAR
jgi:hypothetical protein